MSFGLRRPASVLQAARADNQVTGVFLRADNLTARTNWVLQLAPQGVTTPSQTVTLGTDAHFALTLTAEEQKVPVLEMRSDADHEPRSSGDLQLLALP